MDARFLGLDNIAQTLNLNSKDNLQAFYDSALQERETLDVNFAGFEWADVQLNSEIEYAEIGDYLRGMATYVDSDSEPLARGKQVEITKFSTSIPTMRRKIVRGKNDYRKELLAAEKASTMGYLKGDSPYQSVEDYLISNLFDKLKEIPDSHAASIAYQIDRMKSVRKLALTPDNNEGGLIGLTFDSKVPDSNVKDVVVYNVDTEGNPTYDGADADIVVAIKQDIRKIRRDKYRGYQFVTIEMYGSTFDAIVESPTFLRRLGYSLRPDLQIVPKNNDNALTVGREKYLSSGDEFIKNYFKTAVGADEIIINNTIVGADHLDAVNKKFVTSKINTFEEGVILVRPSGIIGKIFPVLPVRPDRDAVYADIFGGCGILEYMYDKITREQKWISELAVLAVPIVPSKMYYYNVKGTTAQEVTVDA
jgi:hypothetical protein